MNYAEFREAVALMREAQKAYFKTRTGDALYISKQREAAVDKALREYDEGQGKLFENQENA